jgi:hypothetical protein
LPLFPPPYPPQFAKALSIRKLSVGGSLFSFKNCRPIYLNISIPL